MGISLKFSFAQLQDPILKYKPTVADGTAFKFAGMYLGVENDPSVKKNLNILITQWIPDINKKFIYRTDEVYKRRGTFVCDSISIPYNKGDYKYKYGICRENIYSSVTAAWKAASTYPQVSYGQTFRERSVLILDSDDYYESLEEATDLVEKFCNFYKMDKPFSVTRNTSSGHIQVAWPLSRTFTKRGKSYLPTSLPDGSLFYLSFENFNALNKNLARMWTAFTGKDGDMNFNGPSCKNPFYKGFQAQINPDVDYTCDIIPQVITFLINNPLTKRKATKKAKKVMVRKPSKQKAINKSTAKKHLSKNYRNNLMDGNSRRAYEVNNYRTWYFRYRNAHDGKAPDTTMQMTKINELATEAAMLTHKELHSDKELSEIVNTVNKWCNKKYKKGVSGNAVYTEKERSFGRFIQQMQRLLIATQAFSLVNTDKMEIADVCKTLEVSQATVYRALKMSEDDFDQLVKSAKKFLRFAKNVNTASIDFYQKVATIKNTIELYYKFVQVLFKTIIEKIINKDYDPFTFIQLLNYSYNNLLLKIPIIQS